MDKVDLSKELTEDIDSRKELTEDIARESLIAISYKVPDTDLAAAMSPKIANGGKVTEPWVCDGDEKYRSELISISYSASPDMKVLPPPLPVDLDA